MLDPSVCSIINHARITICPNLEYTMNKERSTNEAKLGQRICFIHSQQHKKREKGALFAYKTNSPPAERVRHRFFLVKYSTRSYCVLQLAFWLLSLSRKSMARSICAAASHSKRNIHDMARAT